MKRLEVRLFGQPQFVFEGKPWHFAAPPRALPLLAYLLLRPGEKVSRLRLSTLLWPDDLDDVARANLRRHLHRLVSALPQLEGLTWIESAAGSVWWNPLAPAWIDTEEFSRLMSERSTYGAAVDLYRGDLVLPLDEEWLFAERERFRSAALGALFDLAVEARAQRDFIKAREYAQRILSIDEWREDALRQLMSASYESGDRSAALAAYDHFRQRLQDEMHVEPMPETVALRGAIFANLATGQAGDSSEDLDRRFGGTTQAPLVGRANSMEELERLWLRAARGSGSAIFLSGEAGIGKTRLAREIARLVESQGGRPLIGWTSEPERGSYQSIVDALRAAIPYIVRSDIDTIWLSAIEPLLPEVRGLRPDLPAAEPLGSAAAQTRLHEAFARIVAHLARIRPLCIVLEDLHWAQPETIAAIESLARRIAALPVLLVVTTRREAVSAGHPLRAMRRRLQQEHRAASIELGRLELADLAEMAKLTPALANAPAELPELTYRYSGGNPLFALLLLGAYLETGDLPDDELALRGVGHAIVSRMDRLPADVRTVADVAATIGNDFNIELVSDTGGWPEGAVQEALGQLMDRNLVRESAVPGFQYCFTHALISAAIYEQTPPAHRIARHHRIASILEKLYAEDAMFSGTIARHWHLAQERSRACAAYRRAAQDALRLYAREDAIAYAHQSNSLAETNPERFAALHLACTAQANHTDVRIWKEDLESLTALAQGLTDEERFAAFEMRDAYHWQVGDKKAQRANAEALLAAAGRAGSARWRTFALTTLGKTSFEAGDLNRSLGELRDALSVALSIDDVANAAKVHQHLAEVLIRLGDSSEAEAHIQEVRAHVSKTDNVFEHLELLRIEAAFALHVEQFKMATDAGMKMVDLAVRVGDLAWEAWGHQILAYTAKWYWDGDAVRRHSARADELYAQIGRDHGRAAVAFHSGVWALSVGHLDEAMEHFVRALPLAVKAGSTSLEGYVYANTAECEYLRGNAQAAYDAAAAALRIAVRTGENRMQGQVLRWMGSAEFAMGDRETGIEHVRQSVELRRRLAGVISLTDDLCSYIDVLIDDARYAEAAVIAKELADIYVPDPDRQLYPARVFSALARSAEVNGRSDEAAAHLQRAAGLLEVQIARFMNEEDRDAYRELPFHRSIVEWVSRNAHKSA